MKTWAGLMGNFQIWAGLECLYWAVCFFLIQPNFPNGLGCDASVCVCVCVSVCIYYIYIFRATRSSHFEIICKFEILPLLLSYSLLSEIRGKMGRKFFVGGNWKCVCFSFPYCLRSYSFVYTFFQFFGCSIHFVIRTFIR